MSVLEEQVRLLLVRWWKEVEGIAEHEQRTNSPEDYAGFLEDHVLQLQELVQDLPMSYPAVHNDYHEDRYKGPMHAYFSQNE